MKKYKVQVGRYVREYINFEVEADEEEDAILKGYEHWAHLDGLEAWEPDREFEPEVQRPIILSVEEEKQQKLSQLEIIANQIGFDLSTYNKGE